MSSLEHFDDELRELDERIARLAALCEADLSRTETIAALIHGNFTACARADALALPRLRELRGLLILRYRVEEKCLDEIGTEGCIRLIDDEHERMRRMGIPVRWS